MRAFLLGLPDGVQPGLVRIPRLTLLSGDRYYVGAFDSFGRLGARCGVLRWIGLWYLGSGPLGNDLRFDFLDLRDGESRSAVAVCVLCEAGKEVIIWKSWKLAQEVLDRNWSFRTFGLLFMARSSANKRRWEWSSNFGSGGRRAEGGGVGLDALLSAY
jgi:hypothetical protein